MNKWKLTAIILLTVIGTFLFLAIWGSTMDDEYTEAPVGDIQVRSDFTPAEDKPTYIEGRDAYVEGCMSEGVTESYCQCTFMYINDEIGYDEFLKLAEDYAETNETPQLMYDAVAFCME